MKEIQIPKDTSWEVQWRECNWDFPLWKVDHKWPHVFFPSDPPVCEWCFHIQWCRMYVSNILLMWRRMTREEFSWMSEILSIHGQIWVQEQVHDIMVDAIFSDREDREED